MFDVKEYWNKRYIHNLTSGKGSYDKLGEFKAQIINSFLKYICVKDVIDFGCGDGNQLKMINYSKYIGYDISEEAIKICRQKFKNDKTKKFYTIDEYNNETADLTTSLDVIYHLIDDNMFEEYMFRLFNASKKYVIIYSSNTDEVFPNQNEHIKHRKFTDWIEKHIKDWKFFAYIRNKYRYSIIKNGSLADFYIYKR